MKRHPLLTHLAREVPGGILYPGDPDFAEACTTLIGRGEPDLVVRPRSAEEVGAAVRYARDRRLPLTVRAGGHSMAGLSTATAGVLLDLRRMHDVEVDAASRLVRIGGGASWGPVAEALQPHGLGLTAGDTAGVGVGGLTLGGGIGWMVRRHGLAVDSLVGAELVTADGTVREVSADRHPDLFWAVRGGGGSLGVVTRFDFRAQEVDDVVFGTVTYALTDVRAMATGWRDAVRGADERLTSTLSLLPAMGDQPAVAMLGLCFAGPEADSVAAVRPLLELGTVLSSDVTTRPYAEVLEDEDHPVGMRVAVDNVFLREPDDAAMAAVAATHATGGTVVTLRALGGAFSRIPHDATAFAHRSAEVMITALRFSPGPDAPTLTGIPGWSALVARGTGSYVNLQSDSGPESVAAAYPGRVARLLAELRGRYDPTGLFGGGSFADHSDPAAAS